MNNEEQKKYQGLITKFLSAEATISEREDLNQWISKSAENRHMFEQYKAVWGYKPVETENITINRQSAWQKINERISLTESESNTHTRVLKINRKRLYAISGIAALLVLFAGIYAVIFSLVQPEMISVYANQRLTEPLTLPDGTTVHLNNNSTIHYPSKFTGKQRVVKFEGEAFFEVSELIGNPFIVDLNGATVEVLGTSFNISNYSQSKVTEVAVVSGRVRMKASNPPLNEVILNKGEKGIFNPVHNSLVKEDLNNLNFLAWKTGRLEFDQMSLPEVFNAIEAAYDLKITAEKDFSDLKLTARFSDEDPANIFKTIGMLFSLEIVNESGVYHVR